MEELAQLFLRQMESVFSSKRIVIDIPNLRLAGDSGLELENEKARVGERILSSDYSVALTDPLLAIVILIIMYNGLLDNYKWIFTF